MKSPAHNIALWLVSQNVGEFGGEDQWCINVGVEPDRPDDAITLYDTGGAPADTDQMNIRYPEFQVRVRSRVYPDGYTKIMQIAELLNFMGAENLDGMRFTGVSLTSDVGMIGLDDNDRPVFTANFQAMTRIT